MSVHEPQMFRSIVSNKICVHKIIPGQNALAGKDLPNMSTVSASCFFPPSLSDSRQQKCHVGMLCRPLKVRVENKRAAESSRATYQALSVSARGGIHRYENTYGFLCDQHRQSGQEIVGMTASTVKGFRCSGIRRRSQLSTSPTALALFLLRVTRTGPGCNGGGTGQGPINTWLPTFNHLQTFALDTELSETPISAQKEVNNPYLIELLQRLKEFVSRKFS